RIVVVILVVERDQDREVDSVLVEQLPAEEPGVRTGDPAAGRPSIGPDASRPHLGIEVRPARAAQPGRGVILAGALAQLRDHRVVGAGGEQHWVDVAVDEPYLTRSRDLVELGGAMAHSSSTT